MSLVVNLQHNAVKKTGAAIVGSKDSSNTIL
jgi:hypothetical protein